MRTLTIFIFYSIILHSSFLFSQSNNVQSAGNYLKYDEFEKAKTAIDLAYENPATANDYKMWYYRGKIYWAIYIDKKEEVKKLDKDAAEKATVSFLNYQKTCPAKWLEDDAIDFLMYAATGAYNEGTKAVNSKEYDKATKIYNLVFEVFPYDKKEILKRNNVTPEVIYYNLYIAKYMTNDLKGAKEYLQKLIAANYNDPLIYVSMCRIYLMEKDTVTAMSFVEKGRAKYDDNTDLIAEELNLYIAQGKSDLLVEKLNKAIELRNDNELLYYNRGTLYEQRKETEKAKADYLKALEINPDYFDALYNLGIIYYKQAAEVNVAMNKLDISEQKKYDELKAKRDKLFSEALPNFEKAHDKNPKDAPTLDALRQIYSITNNMEKLTEVKKKISELK